MTRRSSRPRSAKLRRPVDRLRTAVLGLLVGLGLALAAPHDLAAQADGRGGEAKTAGRQWALLIGIERYQRANPLRHTINDVEQLAITLEQRGGVARDRIWKITDTQANPRQQPLRANLLELLPELLAQPTADDQIIVYFSGHGFRDAQGKLYLAPIDCDPANPAPTGIAVEWFRDQLAGCAAGFKLLVLDACHAGSEKGDEAVSSVAAKDMGIVFRDLEGVVTLASSTEDEKSQIWEERQQSLFSYWLNAGLKGHADDNGNGAVTIDELYDYVHRNVTRTAQAVFPRAQTPVRIVRTGTAGVPAVLKLRPQSLDQVLADMAEQLAWNLQERGLPKVGVLEFTSDTRLGELLGADFGLLGRYCAEALERRLAELGRERFAVVDRRRLQGALREQGFTLDDLGSGPALEKLSTGAGGMPVIVLGTLSNRVARLVSLRTKLLQTTSDEVAGSAGGVALLSLDEWAMLGRSVQVRAEDRRPSLSPAPTDGNPSPPGIVDQVVRRLDDRARGTHPLEDPSFPYQVRIVVNGAERPGVVLGNEYYVPLRQGEVYQIGVANQTDQLVLLRLLVDGLNTLPEVEGEPGSEKLVTAKRVHLDRARHWALSPTENSPYVVGGFFESTGERAVLREFRVVDAMESVAARQKFTDQIGIITAAFYALQAGSRAVGTGFGERRGATLRERANIPVGNLLAVLHIRYVDPETLARLAK